MRYKTRQREGEGGNYLAVKGEGVIERGRGELS